MAAGFKLITTKDLKKKMDAGEKLTLVNALSSIEFNEMTIPGSINIPSSKLKAGNALLPADKSGLIIFYCKGPKCTKSKKSAKKAKKLGYTNIMVYNEGIPAWIKAKYPLERKVKYPRAKLARLKPKKLNSMLSSVVILDIRGKELKGLGRIKDVIIMPMDNVEDEYSKIPKDKKVVIVDHAGKQTNICGKFLTLKGYKDVAVLDGGMLGWKRARLPVVK
jgi:rhodanese-related sulfurtransferase